METPMKKLFLSFLLTLPFASTVAMEQSPRPQDCLLVCHVKNNDVWAVRELLKEGANPNTEEVEGVPVLLKALSNNNLAISQLLLEYGANPNMPIRDCFSSTLLNYAMDLRNLPICPLLLEFGADPNLSDVSGNNSLTRAIKVGNRQMCTLLTDHGAKLDAKSQSGLNAFELATGFNSQDLIPLFIVHANFNPCISNREFHRFLNARGRIYAALMAFKHVSPLFVPKDIRKMILRSIPELQQDLHNMNSYGPLKNIHLEHVTKLPLQLVAWLIAQGRLDQEQCAAAITECACDQLIMILVQSNITTRSWFFNQFHLNQWDIYWPTQLSLIPEFTPYFSKIFGPQIERMARKRLGLLTWKNWLTDVMPTSCIVQ